jgi:8-oxo-dGTP pyrophosphatase MutT (NUDIX family)
MNLGNGTPQSPLPSATILMLRDAPAGFEVFLLKRHGLSDVLGGAFVFPGGKLDREDAQLVGRLEQPPREMHAALGEDGLDELQAAALYVAAMREAFEESGVLFAALREHDRAAFLESASSTRRLREVLDATGAALASTRLAPWSRWVTPAASVRARKHFDARFFAAALPQGQEPVHDEHETTESAWFAPAEALRAYWDGRIQLAPPQIMSLVHLAHFRDVAGVLAHARSRKPPRIQPEVIVEAGMNMVCYPGDERHSLGERAMPGPTRLHWRNERYEPEGGLDSLLPR